MLVLAKQGLGEDIVTVLIDVKEAHLNGRVKPENGDHFVTLSEDMGGGCAELNGMRPAARAREEDHCCQAAMVRGTSASTTFHDAATGTRCVVHGDNFTFVGPRKDMQRMTQLMEAWYQIKERAVLGRGENSDREIIDDEVEV